MNGILTKWVVIFLGQYEKGNELNSVLYCVTSVVFPNWLISRGLLNIDI